MKIPSWADLPLQSRDRRVHVGVHYLRLFHVDYHPTTYSPPTGCGAVGSWAAVTLNFTVTSNGTQYDRLGIFTFQNTESVFFFDGHALDSED